MLRKNLIGLLLILIIALLLASCGSDAVTDDDIVDDIIEDITEDNSYGHIYEQDDDNAELDEIEVMGYEIDPNLEMDSSVSWLVEPTWDFDAVFDFRNNMSAVEIFDDEIHIMGYINNLGEIVIPIELTHYAPHYFYRGGPPFAYGSVGIHSLEHDAVAFFNTNGEQITPFMFNDAYGFSEGLAAVQGEDGKWGFVDPEANVVIPIEFSQVGSFSDGLAAVGISKTIELDPPFEYYGHIITEQHIRYWGFIDKSGEVVIPFDFEGITAWLSGYIPPRFSDGVAPVWKMDWDATPIVRDWGDDIGHWGVIDKSGFLLFLIFMTIWKFFQTDMLL
jgi:hypothetical protein